MVFYRLILTILLLAKLPLGKMTVLLSGVIKVVWKISISETTPISPYASINSPNINGLNINIKQPPAKFANAPYIANPIANATPAKIAANVVIFTPNLSITIKNNIIFKNHPNNDNKNNERVLSYFYFFSHFFNKLMILFIIQRPIISINNAPIILGT